LLLRCPPHLHAYLLPGPRHPPLHLPHQHLPPRAPPRPPKIAHLPAQEPPAPHQPRRARDRQTRQRGAPTASPQPHHRRTRHAQEHRGAAGLDEGGPGLGECGAVLGGAEAEWAEGEGVAGGED
ncbi:MAG: hypothetical protein LQ346_009130, partial [Caloplaca aetnensis]